MIRDADEFYKLRDLRTTESAHTDKYQHQRVAVVLHPALADTYRGQFMLLLGVNLLARYCRHVTVVCPDVVVKPQLAENHVRLPDEVISVMRGADPFGTFTWQDEFASWDVDYILQIGGGEIPGILPSLTIDAEGWRVAICRRCCPSGFDEASLNPVGPGVAAALGVAEALKAALELDPAQRIEHLYLSCWDYTMTSCSADIYPGSPLPTVVDIGRTWLIGAGMVGSALSYFLRRLPIMGQLDVIDHDVVAIHNLSRSPVFQYSHSGTRKASLVAHYLASTRLEVEAYPVLFDAFLERNPRRANSVDLIFAEANQYKVREQIQHMVPPLTLHATTSVNGLSVLGRHRPLTDDCLACRFPSDAVQPSTVCGTTKLGGDHTEARTNSADIALPYQATLGAAMLAGELIQVNLPGYPLTPNYVALDTLSSLRRSQRVAIPKRTACAYCLSQGADLHQALNGNSRFAHVWRGIGD